MTAVVDGTLGVSLCAANSVPAGALQAASVAASNLIQPLTLGTAQATTSGTSIDFTGIPSWVKRITVSLQGVSTNGTSEPILRIGTSAGVQTTGYNGATYFVAGGSAGSRPYSTAPNSSGGFWFFNAVTASQALEGSFVLTILNPSTGLWAGNGAVGDSTSNTAFNTAGSKTLSGTLDRIRLTTVNGTDTFDAGSVNILYE